MLNDFVAYVAAELRAFAQAPGIFVLALLVCAAVVWRAVRSIYTSRIDRLKERMNNQVETLNERIKVRDDQIGQFQEKLKADSPSDALVRIGELTAKLDALSIGKWDPLTPDQAEGIRSRLAKLPPADLNIRVAYDARALGRSLNAAFEELGWKTHGSKWMGSDYGVSIFPKSETSEAIADALRTGGGFDVTVRDDFPTRPLTLDIGEKPW
jgi:hypothetical protein